MVKILPILRGTHHCLFYQGRVFRMHPFESKFQRWFRRSVVLEDSKGFLRPENLAGGGLPAEAATVAYALRLSQESFVTLQLSLLHFQGFCSESPIHPGRQQSQSQDDKGDGGNSG